MWTCYGMQGCWFTWMSVSYVFSGFLQLRFWWGQIRRSIGLGDEANVLLVTVIQPSCFFLLSNLEGNRLSRCQQRSCRLTMRMGRYADMRRKPVLFPLTNVKIPESGSNGDGIWRMTLEWECGTRLFAKHHAPIIFRSIFFKQWGK